MPQGTPAAVVERLRTAMSTLAADAAFQQTILRTGSPLKYLDAPDFGKYWSADVSTMTEVVRRIGKVE